MKKVNLSLSIFVAAILVVASIGVITTTQSAYAQTLSNRRNVPGLGAPIAVSGNNVYVTWWTNKTGDWEVFFKASPDSGKTFGSKLDLSNSKGVVSNDASIAASGSNVYVSWWERTDKSDEPVMKVSNDNGKTFGEKIMLSNNATTAKPLL